ncbi:MAG: hypothetical protein OEZ13_05385 [Spirochaetia bacterium]|nr:hypothetical protein [Spirochaetia bacterium]
MKKIFGNIENFSLEHRIFNLVAIIAFLSCQYIWINAVSLDLPITISSASSLIGIIIGIFYYFSRFKNKFTFLIWPLLILLLLLFSTNWFFSSGYDGTTFFGHLATFCAALMLLSKRSIIIFILIYILNFTFLIFFQMNYPETIMPYQNQSIEFIDKINTMIIISIVLYFMISLLVDNYRIERKKLKEQRNELRERNDIIEKELEMARKIQLNLIPSISPNSNIAFYYQPMDKVGGDFFEFIEYNNKDLLGVFISDVSGTDFPPLLLLRWLKASSCKKTVPLKIRQSF